MGSFSRLVHSRPTPCLLGPPEHLARPLRHAPTLSSPGWARFHLPPPRIWLWAGSALLAQRPGLVAALGQRAPGAPQAARAVEALWKSTQPRRKEHGTHAPGTLWGW